MPCPPIVDHFAVLSAPVRRVSAVLVLLAAAASQCALAAAEPAPVLVVPACRVAVQVAVDCPAKMRLDRSALWQLEEVAHPETKVLAQAVASIAEDGSAASQGATLVADIPPREPSVGPRRFRLLPLDATTRAPDATFRFDELSDKSLRLSEGDRPVLVYNHGVITGQDVPQDEPRRRRACYVHPLWGLRGEVLTDDFPKDHYHHHGVFWTWPHIGIDGKEYDLWAGDNIEDKFSRWLDRESGALASALAVENGWFVGPRQVMTERVWLRVFRAANDSLAIDLVFTWIPRERPITLRGAEGKSYGGLTVRFAPGSREDTLITVPSGRTTDDLPEAPLAWADFTSKFGNAAAQSGGAIFVHPAHPDYPPTWLTRYYGPLCVGWPGVKPKTFEPDKPIRLVYRIWIHGAAVSPEQLSEAYAGYTAAAGAKWE